MDVLLTSALRHYERSNQVIFVFKCLDVYTVSRCRA